MARTLLLGDEIALPTTTGTATSFSSATVVRLVNTTSSVAVITVVETQSGTGIGSFTMLGNTTELLEKNASYCVFSSAATVKGAKVGFTG
jgi:hypothetical protein